jgi:putative FmdB family regulatory protein
MPTYEYACTRCGQHVEVVQSMSDPPLRECAACGGPLRKVFSPIGIVFKGSGFYRTDSRPTEPAKQAGKEPGKEGAGGDAAKAKDGSAKPATDKAPSGSAKPARSA